MAKEKPTVSVRRLRAIPKARFSIALVVAAIAVEAAFHAQLPLSAGLLVDKVLSGKDRDALLDIIGLLVAGFAAALVAGLLRDWLYTKLQVRALANLRQVIFERLQYFSTQFYEATSRTEILETFSDDLSTMESAWSMAVTWGLLPAIESLVFSAAVLWLDWRIGLLSLLLWPWIVLAPNTFTRHLTAATDKYKDDEVRTLGVVEESLLARLVVRAFSLEQLGINLFRKRNEVLAADARRVSSLLAFMDRFTQTGILFLQVMIVTLSALLAFDDQMTAGKLVSIPILTFLLAQSLLLISEYLPAFQNGRDAWQRVYLGMKDPAPVPDKAGAKPLAPLQDEIVFQNVSAGTLVDFSVSVKRGSHVAFVEPEGAATSAIVPLLLRLSDPSSGSISFDGVDLKSVTQISLRSRLGVVPQSSFMFNASVRENVRMANPAATEEKLRDLMQTARIASMAQTLPQGMDTSIGQNGNRIPLELVQKIAIGRALLKNPDVLVLDEAAFALDNSAEKSFNDDLRDLIKDRTTVTVTHRLAAACDADLICMVAAGRIAEQGTHSELIAADGMYAQAWRRQNGFRFSTDGSHVDVDAQRLQLIPAFEDFDEEILAELAPFFITATYPPGRDIVSEEDPCDRFCILARGEAEARQLDIATGEDIVEYLLRDGDYIGENAFTEDALHPFTVRARTICTCISIGRGQFRKLLDRYPELRQKAQPRVAGLIEG